MMAGAWQLTSWIFALLDAIVRIPPSAPNKKPRSRKGYGVFAYCCKALTDFKSCK